MTRTTMQAKSRQRAETPAQWLEELGSALRMPYERAEAIREELAEHLRERVRDLELEGLDEAAAASVAVRELGDAAAVARRFRSAELLPIRRRLMNLAVIGIAGVALVTSIVAVSGDNAPPEETPQVLLERAITAMDDQQQPSASRAYVELALEGMKAEPGSAAKREPLRLEYAIALQGREPVAAELPAEASRWRGFGAQPEVSVEALKADGMQLQEVLKWMATQAKATPVMRWKQLEESQIVRDEPVTVNVGATDLAAVMTAVNESLGESEQQGPRTIEYRIKDGTIEFAPQSYFDKREAHVVRYDIAGLLESGIELDAMRELIQGFVEPDLWVDNGGELAVMKFVGGKLFVKAPPRMQEGVKWYIEQLSSGKPAAQADAEAPQVVQVYHLKHTRADDVLKAIMANQQIRAIDFTHFVADERTNSIIGRTTAPEHRIVEDAIEALDVEIANGGAVSAK